MSALASFAWIFCTISASAAQTARNAMQRDLTRALGTAGATHVRFLFSLPFIFTLFAFETLVLGWSAPALNAAIVAWTAVGAGAQAIATGLMLAGMRERSFVAVTAYTKIEPIVIALFGAMFLGDVPSLQGALAIVIATSGVLLMSWPRRSADDRGGARAFRPAALGLTSGALFALSAVGYRGALVGMTDASVAMKATTALVIGLSIQCVAILTWLALRDRATLAAIVRDWRKSLFAGFMGAVASQLWLMAFALASAAAVRTLALIEVPMAQLVTRRLFRQRTSPRELAGMALIVAGVALLLNG